MVMSNLEVDVLDELGSGSKFILGSPQLVPEVGHRRVLSSVWVGQFLQNVFCRVPTGPGILEKSWNLK